MINENDNKPLIGDDLTTDANAREQTSDLRESALSSVGPLTRYNVNEKFITAKFASIDDAKAAYEELKDKGYDEDVIVLAIPGAEEDQFFKSFKALKDEFSKDDKGYAYVSMGMETQGRDDAHLVSSIWDKHHAIGIND